MGLNVVIGEDLARFVMRKVESGEYDSPEHVIEEALRVLRIGDREEPIGATEEERLAWLRAAWKVGVASGIAGHLDFEALKAEARRRRASRQR
jgi:antitoxin ParD1/3/4